MRFLGLSGDRAKLDRRLRLNGKPGLFRHCSLPGIEGDKLRGSDHDGGGDVDYVKSWESGATLSP